MRFMQSGKDLFPRHARHTYVQQNHVGRIDEAFGQPLSRIDINGNRNPGRSQHSLDVFPQRGFVVNDQDSAHSVVPPANQ